MSRDKNDPIRVIAAAGVAGLVIIAALAAYALQPGTPGWGVFGTGIVVAGAGLLAGGLTGLLFGIPRSLQQRAAVVPADGDPTSSPASAESRGRYQPNTNLEEISDWLTKIMVGVGLTQFGEIRQQILGLISYLTPGFGTSPAATPFVAGLLTFSSVAGFLAGYLLARLYLPRALVAADILEVAERVQVVVDQNQADVQLNVLVSRQLSGEAQQLPRQEELDEAVKAASPLARNEVFWRARNNRSAVWRTDKEKVERVVPIFRALIASDPNGLQHAYHSEFGYALKDKARPDNQEAIAELTRAIEIRDRLRDVGYIVYEFNRAFARIRIELSAGESPSDEGSRQAILADLRQAIGNDFVRDLIGRASSTKGKLEPENEDLRTWLQRNGVTLADLEA
jgi:tetratricopeptide (TPR) repeat protein